MLTKLLKYEFRATARVMLPLYLILLATALGANLSTRGMGDLGTLLVLAFALAILAVFIMSVVIMAQRFRQNLLGDEGYLMFTLPVSVHHHLWAKMIVSAVWFAASLLAVILAAMLSVSGQRELLEFFREFGRMQLSPGEWANFYTFLLELVVLGFVSSFTLCLQFYASMAVGYSFSSHKTLWSVGAFLLLSMVSSVVTSILDFDIDFDEVGLLAPGPVHLLMWVVIAGCIVVGAVYYCITAYFLKNRLNLA